MLYICDRDRLLTSCHDKEVSINSCTWTKYLCLQLIITSPLASLHTLSVFLFLSSEPAVFTHSSNVWLRIRVFVFSAYLLQCYQFKRRIHLRICYICSLRPNHFLHLHIYFPSSFPYTSIYLPNDRVIFPQFIFVRIDF